MRRRTLAVVIAATAVVAACSSPASDLADQQSPERLESTPAPDATVGIEPGLADFYTQTLSWSSCGGDFQCSTLTVPLDYADPDGETIELSVLRSPATSDDPVGSLLVNPGGPGGSAVEYARAARSVATEKVLERYDIVGVDPRGVGESTPIDCVDDAELDDYLSVDPSPDDDDEIAALQAAIEEFNEGCVQTSGDLLPHIGTPDVARDMDVLRAALGDEKLTYLGKSYGTFLGAVYADLFPERVGRLVLDGAIDPALSGDAVALGQAQGFEQALDSFLTWCVDEGCSIGEDKDSAREALATLIDRVDSEPLDTGDDERPLNQSLAMYGVILPLYLSADEGYPTLDTALDLAINEDDGSLLLTLADLYLDRSSDGVYNGNQNEVITAVNCFDRPESITVEQAEAKLPEYEAASPMFGSFLAWGGLACSSWPVPSTSAPAPIAATGAAPILVVGTTGDPATPYPWAQALAEQLESGVLLTYEGSVHTAYLSGSSCIDEAVDAYLLDGTVPDEGLTCT